MLNRIAIVYLIVFLFLLLMLFLISLFKKNINEYSKKFFWYIIVVATISLTIVSYYIEPPFEWDLYRHFQILNRMKNGGINYVLNSSNYKELFIINYFYYFISLTGNNHLLPAITVLICCLIFLKIYHYFVYDNAKISLSIKLILFVLFFALFNIVLAISGIRTNLSIIFCALGIYLECSKNNKIIPFLFYVSSLFIHPVSIVFIISRILILFKSERIFFIFIFISFIFDYALMYFSNSNIPIFKYIIDIVGIYEKDPASYSPYITLLNVGFVILFLLNTITLYFKYKVRTLDIKISLVYSCLCLGFLFNLIFFYRCIMFLSFLSVMVYSRFFEKINFRKSLTLIIIGVYGGFTLSLNIIQLMSVINW